MQQGMDLWAHFLFWMFAPLEERFAPEGGWMLIRESMREKVSRPGPDDDGWAKSIARSVMPLAISSCPRAPQGPARRARHEAAAASSV